MRGYFGIGVESISKQHNVGSLLRSAHAFGASYFFAIAPALDMQAIKQVDTSGAVDHIPIHTHDHIDNLQLGRGCQLVGIELTDESIDLPSFRHPLRAAYILGPEKGSLSPEVQDKCDFLIKIPMKFCVNVGVAGALVMYDRLLTHGRFVDRPVKPGGPTEPKPSHHHGGSFSRKS